MTRKITRSGGFSTYYNNQTSSYVLTKTDDGKIVEMEGSADVTVRVPSKLVSSFRVGAEISIINISSNKVSITADDDVELRCTSEAIHLDQMYQIVTLRYRGDNSWYVIHKENEHVEPKLRSVSGLSLVDFICVLPHNPIGDLVNGEIRVWRDDENYVEYSDVEVLYNNGVPYIDLQRFPFDTYYMSPSTVTISMSMMAV